MSNNWKLTRQTFAFSACAMLLINFIYLLSLIIWIGSIIFFSFITAPSLFKALPPEFASKAIGAIFPKYYPVGYISGAFAFMSLIFHSAKTGIWSPLKMFLLIVMIALTLFASLNIHPKARALKEEMQAATDTIEHDHLKVEFDRVHKISVVYNGIVLLLGLILILITASNITL